MKNILLCGGSGTRLWPISRQLMPKQFCKLFGDKSLFQLTVERNSEYVSETILVSNQDQYFLGHDQLDEINYKNARYILEPIGRNTAPAIAITCMQLDPEEIVLVTPSDHLIKTGELFKQAINRAKTLAKDGFLVTFGIKPTSPETGYGYIKFNNEDVKEFIEKPDLNTAQKYLDDGSYLWNSGMFCFKAGVFLDELKELRPDIYEACKIKSKFENDYLRISLDEMQNIPAESIDYAVMEKTKKSKVVISNFDWSDVGGFDALCEHTQESKHYNVYNHGSVNTTVVEQSKTVATIDCEDLIIVDTADALLISKKGSSQKVKDLLPKIKNDLPELTQVHRTANRPWGSYTVLHEQAGYKVKSILVKPNSKLSLQRHKYRSEHWVVVSGSAVITNGDNVFELQANESTYIPAGQVHRLENKTDKDLVIIEAQVGKYLGEDDIERLADDYNR